MTLATRRATAALAAVLAMAGAAAGCGDDSDSGNDDNSTAAVGVEDGEPTEAAGPADTNSDDAVDVDGALLQLTDMPDGWAQLPEAEDTGEPPLCGVDSDAQASYALDRNTGPIVMHEVTAAGGDPAAHFAEAAGLLDGCEASYGGFGYQFTDLNVPEVG